MRRESDVMSIACFLKDLVFSKVNVKVLGDTGDIASGTNSASLFRSSYSSVASTFALIASR